MTVIDHDWVELRRFRRLDDARSHALVLSARGISSRVEPSDGRVGLSVPRADVVAAHAELTAFARENRPRRQPPPVAVRPASEGVGAAIAYAVVLVIAQAMATRGLFGIDWFAAGSAAAAHIRAGEIWRAVTALGLHADFGHLAGNVAAGGLFGALLAQTLGGGLAFLAAIAGGMAGNLLNAMLQGPAHNAVGASTAVFAILGTMTVLAWRREAWLSRRGLFRTLAPLAAGATLLGIFGTGGGPRTDVGAHLLGFVAGGALGLALHAARNRIPTDTRAQWLYGGAAFGAFALAWVVALSAG